MERLFCLVNFCGIMIVMNRNNVIDKFNEYTSAYDLQNPKIRLKYEHTFRVATLCDTIAKSLNLSSSDIDLAWLIGMLHDIGRFEQVRRFGTFVDKESVDHANFGADLLFSEVNRDERLIFDIPEKELVEIAIRNHSRFRIATDLSERETLFCNIIRDADKIDILRVHMEFSFFDTLNITEEELLNSTISKQAMDAVMSGQAIERNYSLTPMDRLIAQASMMQELSFPASKQIVRDNNYLEHLLDVHPTRPEVAKQMDTVRAKINDWLNT